MVRKWTEVFFFFLLFQLFFFGFRRFAKKMRCPNIMSLLNLCAMALEQSARHAQVNQQIGFVVIATMRNIANIALCCWRTAGSLTLFSFEFDAIRCRFDIKCLSASAPKSHSNYTSHFRILLRSRTVCQGHKNWRASSQGIEIEWRSSKVSFTE